MLGVEEAVSDSRAAVADLRDAARALPAEVFASPGREGGWSPAEIVEHVAIAYDVARRVLEGAERGGVPRLLRPLLRRLVLRPILATGTFRRGAKAPRALRPRSAPGTAEDVVRHLERAAEDLHRALLEAAATGRVAVDDVYFGRVRLPDYGKLQAAHARHHRRQLPSGYPGSSWSSPVSSSSPSSASDSSSSGPIASDSSPSESSSSSS